MALTVNDARAIGAVATVEKTEVSDGLRLARYCTLDEMSGLVYAVLTLTWIALSLIGVAL
ncbi:MAG TPA: hypothetical protein VEY94_15050 [Patescibacteria group bacterium]|nr:hypothetical protein [Patescibacteria group bacterium]